MKLSSFRPHLGRGKMMTGRFLGPELIPTADGDFSGGQGNWVVSNPAEITFDNVAMNFNLTAWRTAKLTIIAPEGNLFRVQFDVSAYTSGDISAFVGNLTQTQIAEAVATFVLFITAGPGNYVQFAGNNFIGSIDNVSLRAVL